MYRLFFLYMYYQQLELGFNYRLSDLQAALGISQLQRLDEFVARRHVISSRYNEALQYLPLVTLRQHPDGYSGLHLYVIRVKPGEIRKTHREVFEALRTAGIDVNLHYTLVYRQPYYARMGFTSAEFPEVERYNSEAISLPIYPKLAEDEQNHVIESVNLALYFLVDDYHSLEHINLCMTTNS